MICDKFLQVLVCTALVLTSTSISFAGNDGGGGGLTIAADFERLGNVLVESMREVGFSSQDVTAADYHEVLNSTNTAVTVIRKGDFPLSTAVALLKENTLYVSYEWESLEVYRKILNVGIAYSLVIERNKQIKINKERLAVDLLRSVKRARDKFFERNYESILKPNKVIRGEGEVLVQNTTLGLSISIQESATDAEIIEQLSKFQLSRIQIEALQYVVNAVFNQDK